MKKQLFSAIFLFSFILGCGQKNVSVTKSNWEGQQLADSVLQNFLDSTQLAIAIIKNNRTEFYGLLKEKDKALHIENSKSIFEIGSITKVFTATLLANTVQENKIALKDTINPHLGFAIKNDYIFTFEQLANHSSGLPRMPGNFMFYSPNPENPYKDYGEKALKDFMENHMSLVNYQKNQYEYSNLGMGLLGYVLSKMYNQSYTSLLSDKIFKKYKMTNTYGAVSENKDGIVKGRNEKGEAISNWDFDVLAGAGSIVSNVEDLSQFVKAQFNKDDKTLSLSRQETLQLGKSQAIGLGWNIDKNIANNTTLYWHNGGTGGYTSCMVVDVENKKGIVLLSNVSAFHEKSDKIDQLAFELMDKLK